MIIAAAPQPALAEALRAAGCADVDTFPLDEATALLTHERAVELVVIEIVEAAQLGALSALTDKLRGASFVALVPEHLLDAAFETGVSDCVATPARSAELLARLRAALRSAHPQHSTRRERRLTD